MALKSLQTLIKLHKRRIDLLRREVVSLEEERKQLIVLTHTLQEEHQKELQISAENPLLGRFFASYSKNTKERLENIASEIDRLTATIEAKTEIIREEFGEQKKYELLHSEQKLRLEQKAAKQSSQFLDDVGMQQFIRTEDSST